ncbi:nitroreductase [Sporolactobacillus terrae]|uniref:Putative NAD(P)H nitroreductase n=1 Tax=Sporolactobacillus terrae TaxID=269673 RepID=A0A410D9M9_9BACL|nr:nitroreductase [Sporolactobacillus terrae]QAA22809.1 nitroreductase [Sporolactobacillus terrae]QAA25782.1 nitroreductase [Sporolactobacillus terrae]UAK17661.1 nitroreductase [Sporolactobacillus terrae]BBN99204.1 NAD(P)H nitroreductase [Sporolactobacillus terrae]
METIKAIRTRRSVRKVSDKEPSRELIEQILDAARRAPNHMNTEPWHFIVLTGEGRNKLGAVYGKENQKTLKHADQETLNAAYEKGIASAKRAPVIIVVTMEPSDNPRAVAIEDVAATACAVENLMLAAHELGLGSIWRTGGAAYTDEAKKVFGVSEKGRVMGFVYVGYPEEGVVPKVPERKSVAEISEWIDA